MSKPFRLAFVTKNKTNPAYHGARSGAARVAANFGCTVEDFVPEKPDDVDEQRVLIEAAIETRPDGFVIAPAHPSALDPTLRRIKELGAPLVHFVTDTEGQPADCFVTADNYGLAHAIAGVLCEHLGGRGGLVVMEGHPISPTTLPRTQGFLDAVAAHPGCRVIEQVIGNYQRADARQAMAGVLARGPEFDGVVAANDYMALGVLDEMTRAGRRAPVVGVNATPDGIEAITTGQMLATSAFDAMIMGCIATEAAIRLLRGEPVPGRIELPVEIVDAGNCAAWDLPYEKRPLPEWERVVP